jgi:hypothetical protein
MHEYGHLRSPRCWEARSGSNFFPASLVLNEMPQTGGKEEGAQGVGIEVGKVDDAINIAQQYFAGIKQ